MMGMPTCRELSSAIAAGKLDDAPWRRRLGARVHLLLCRHCRRYSLQIRALGRAGRVVFAEPGREDESLARLRRALLERPKDRRIPSDDGEP